VSLETGDTQLNCLALILFLIITITTISSVFLLCQFNLNGG